MLWFARTGSNLFSHGFVGVLLRDDLGFIDGGRWQTWHNYGVEPAIQKLMGHQDVRTTMKYTQVLSGGPVGVKSPLDKL
jgi:integrase